MRAVKIVVEFGRTVKPADYESRAARAMIEYMIEDGEDVNVSEALDAGFEIACDHVLTRVGLKKQDSLTESGGGSTTRSRQTKAKAAATKAPAPDPIPTSETVQEAPAEVAAAPEPAPAKSAPASVLDDDTGPTEDQASLPFVLDDAPPVITNAQLAGKVSAHVAAMKAAGKSNAPQLVTALIQSFNPNPGKPFLLSQLEQDRRAEFLDKLKAL